MNRAKYKPGCCATCGVPYVDHVGLDGTRALLLKERAAHTATAQELYAAHEEIARLKKRRKP